MDGCNRFLHYPLASHPKLVTREKRLSKSDLLPILLKITVPTTLPEGFSWAMLSCQDVTDHCGFAGSADSPLSICRDGSHTTIPR